MYKRVFYEFMSVLELFEYVEFYKFSACNESTAFFREIKISVHFNFNEFFIFYDFSKFQ